MRCIEIGLGIQAWLTTLRQILMQHPVQFTLHFIRNQMRFHDMNNNDNAQGKNAADQRRHQHEGNHDAPGKGLFDVRHDDY